MFHQSNTYNAALNLHPKCFYSTDNEAQHLPASTSALTVLPGLLVNNPMTEWQEMHDTPLFCPRRYNSGEKGDDLCLCKVVLLNTT